MAISFKTYFKHYSLRAALCLWSIVYGLSSSAQNPDFINWKNDAACVTWVDSVYDKLTVEERIGQFFMVAAYTQGNNYNMDSVVRMVKSGKAGGVIFFKGMPEAQATWTNTIQDSAKVGAFIAIDGEWGLAMRLDSTVAFPRQITLGAVADNKLIYEMGREIGRQCKRIGLNINFAPDVDVNNNPNNPVINDRSFGEDKYKVSLKGVEYADGMQDEGVLACAKHFPGHGDTDKDSHKELPSVVKSFAALDSLELYPFKILFKNAVGSVMVAHLNVPALDSTPGSVASVSPKIATDLLQNKMGFKGLIFSDALNMKGVSAAYKPGTVDSIAFMAGDDILVFSEDAGKGIAKIKTALDSNCISAVELEQRVKKVLAYKYKLGLNQVKRVDLKNLGADLNNPTAKNIRQKLYEQAITVAANLNGLLPFKKWNYKRVASLSIGSNNITAFQQSINMFAEMDLYCLPLIQSTLDSLAQYDLVIIDLHGMVRASARDFGVTEEARKFIEALSGRTKVVLTVFGNPYSLKFFEYLPWVMVAYEDYDVTNVAAANAMFGAERITGKLPVTSCKTFTAGTGFVSDTIYRMKIASPEEAGIASEKLVQVETIIRDAINQKAFPGCQLLVAKDGKVIWNKTYGTKVYEFADSVTATDIYDLASITKVAATTLAVMKLVEQRKLLLDKTVDDYINLPRGSTIKHLKIKDILTHQAGLKAFYEFYKKTIGPGFDTYYRRVPGKDFSIQVADSLYMRNDYRDSMWHIIATGDVADHPKYVYSDNDFYILQRLVEFVSGKKLDEYVSETFYKPMGLTRIGYCPLGKFAKARVLSTENDTLFRKQIVKGYVHDPGAAMYGGVAGHAGLFSNAFDLAAVFQMLLNNGVYNGQRFLDSATIAQFTSRQSKISRRGYGFDKPEPDISKPSPCYDGVPLSVFGHTGFTGTAVWSDPENNLTYIFLSNRVYPNADNNMLVKMNVRTQLQEVIYKSFGK